MLNSLCQINTNQMH